MRQPPARRGYPLLLEFWRDGAIAVETPLDLASPVIKPGATELAFRTAIQWDGDIVHRYNPSAVLPHQAAHTAALQRILSEFQAELSRVLGQLTWCGRGLWACRVGIAGGAALLAGSQADIMPALQSLATAYVYPAVASVAAGAGAEVGLRYLRGYLRDRIMEALDAASAGEGQPDT
jgi:hypothetical protein